MGSNEEDTVEKKMNFSGTMKNRIHVKKISCSVGEKICGHERGIKDPHCWK